MRPRLLLALWLLTDLALFVSFYVCAYFLRVGFYFSSDFPFRPFLWSVLTVAPVWLLVLGTTRTFALMRNQRTLRNAAYIAYAALVGVALFSLTYYFQFKESFQGVSRLLLLLAFLFSSVGIWLWHLLFHSFRRTILRRSPPSYPTLIIGATREAGALIAELNRHFNPLTPVAILDGRGASEKELSGIPVLGKLDRLEETLEKEKITHMIQCSDLEQTLNLLSACRKRSITFLLLPSVLGIVEADKQVESLEGHPVTVVRPAGPRWEEWFFR